jgi:hypothetical protein
MSSVSGAAVPARRQLLFIVSLIHPVNGETRANTLGFVVLPQIVVQLTTPTW